MQFTHRKGEVNFAHGINEEKEPQSSEIKDLHDNSFNGFCRVLRIVYETQDYWVLNFVHLSLF
jgi:hypothetical protein